MWGASRRCDNDPDTQRGDSSGGGGRGSAADTGRYDGETAAQVINNQ